jgi:hypothetical protein
MVSRPGDLAFGVRRRGVTLIEAVLFIAVALGVIAGGLVFYQQASTALMTRNAIQQLTAYASEIRALYERPGEVVNRQNGHSLDLEPILIASGGVPASLIDETGTQIMTPWGGDFGTFGRTTGLDCDNDHRPFFVFHLWNVPRNVCTRLASFREGGNGVFAPDIGAIVFYSPEGTKLGSFYANRWPDYCLVSNGGDVPDEFLRDSFPPNEAAVMCSQIDPNDNRLMFGMFPY